MEQHRQFGQHCSAKQGGFSLVELMVAVTISLALLAGMITVVTNSSRGYGELEKTSRQLENGRYAIQLLREEVQLAGFYSEYSPSFTTPATTPDPCNTTIATLADDLALPIQGYDEPTGAATTWATANDTAVTCALTDANHADGTDVLVIRRASTVSTDVAALDANEVYLQANNSAGGSNTVVDVGANSGSFSLTTPFTSDLADIRRLRVDLYYISPCSIPEADGNCAATSDGGNPIPTLKRLTLKSSGGSTAFVTEPLVEGIENMQIEYGIDRDRGTGLDGVPKDSAAGAGDAYETLPDDMDEWSNVVALKIHLLARNIEPTTGHTDEKTYNLGLAGTVSPGGSYKRHLFSTVVRATNISSRREQP